jgi:hypothetical protein
MLMLSVAIVAASRAIEPVLAPLVEGAPHFRGVSLPMVVLGSVLVAGLLLRARFIFLSDV